MEKGGRGVREEGGRGRWLRRAVVEDCRGAREGEGVSEVTVKVAVSS